MWTSIGHPFEGLGSFTQPNQVNQTRWIAKPPDDTPQKNPTDQQWGNRRKCLPTSCVVQDLLILATCNLLSFGVQEELGYRPHLVVANDGLSVYTLWQPRGWA